MVDPSKPRLPIGTILEVIVPYQGHRMRYNLRVGERIKIVGFKESIFGHGRMVYECLKMRKNSNLTTAVGFNFDQQSMEKDILDFPRSGFFAIVEEDRTDRTEISRILGQSP